ncbi:related to 3-phytase A precursor [Ustilago trichophora]|uniref:Related to 3-phytase A n=1 Tax=Ustilago trichophora TaxID=86804 RepID=A0A5C3ECM4_9BASI|nr:related to 3-phytase A precursor [Ustilago trichophora]
MPAVAHTLPAAGAAGLHTPHLPGPSLLPPDIFHNLGQYSPWFPADAASFQSTVPDQCTVTFVSQLERHGSRYPTNGAYKELRKTLRQIGNHLKRVPDASKHNKVDSEGLDPELKWLRHWVETKKTEDGGLRNRLGNSELTPYGQYEAYSSGWRFYEQYADLFKDEHVDVNADFDVAYSSQAASSKRLLASLCEAPHADVAFSSGPGSQLFSHARRGLCHMIRSGSSLKHPHEKHHQRPFVRASGADRVITTSRFWLQGFAHSPHKPFRRPVVLDGFKGGKPHRRIRNLPEPDVIIPEARKSDKLGQIASNNTLDVYTCSAFEHDYRDNAQSPASLKTAAFAYNATAAIRERLASQMGVRRGGSKDRRGERIHLEPKQVLQLFSLCAFDTVARLDPYGLLQNKPERNNGAVSPFCGLFKQGEFASIYEVATNMEKDYGFAAHNPLHKSLATPWLRELLARLEDRPPVMTPPTSINTTLDDSSHTFPLPQGKGPKAFVDFTHDNQLAPIIAALGVWEQDHEWVTSLTTPFSGRLTIEKLNCGQDDFVRVLINDQPASASSGTWCPKAAKGTAVLGNNDLCPLSAFLEPLRWVDSAEEWDKCYTKSNNGDKTQPVSA